MSTKITSKSEFCFLLFLFTLHIAPPRETYNRGSWQACNTRSCDRCVSIWRGKIQIKIVRSALKGGLTPLRPINLSTKENHHDSLIVLHLHIFSFTLRNSLHFSRLMSPETYKGHSSRLFHSTILHIHRDISTSFNPQFLRKYQQSTIKNRQSPAINNGPRRLRRRFERWRTVTISCASSQSKPKLAV